MTDGPLILGIQPKIPFQPFLLMVWKRSLLERDGHLIVELVLDVVDRLCVKDSASPRHVLEADLEVMRTGDIGHCKPRLVGALVPVVSVLRASHAYPRIESGAVLETGREFDDGAGIPRCRGNLVKLAIRAQRGARLKQEPSGGRIAPRGLEVVVGMYPQKVVGFRGKADIGVRTAAGKTRVETRAVVL